jgi:hypothetical protein
MESRNEHNRLSPPWISSATGKPNREAAPVIYLQRRSALWTPFNTDTALWLSAKASSTITIATGVSAWSDRKQNGITYTQSVVGSQPAYLATGFNNLPTIQNVSADSLTVGPTGLGRDVSGITVAVVGSHPAGVTFNSNASEFFISSGTAANAARFLVSSSINGTNKYGLGGRRLDADGFAFSTSTADAIVNRGSPWIRVAQRNFTTAVANHWTNGTRDLIDASIGTTGSTSNTNALASSIFGGVSNTPNGTNISEIVVIHSALSVPDVERLIGYLHWEWNCASLLPSGFAYKNAPPTI